MMNIGYNPTIGNNDQTIEVNLFDIDEDLYNERINVEFIAHIRSEQKFDSLTDLNAQLHKDKATAQQLIASAK